MEERNYTEFEQRILSLQRHDVGRDPPEPDKTCDNCNNLCYNIRKIGKYPPYCYICLDKHTDDACLAMPPLIL